MLGQDISIYLNSFLFKSNLFDYFIYFLAEVLPFVLFGVITVYFFFIKKDSLRFLSICLIAVTSLALSEILKFIFSHPRPFLALSEIAPLFTLGGMDSFPSGHATVFGALTTAVYFENKKLGLLFIFGSLLIGIARVFSGVHYLIDILAGFAIGFLIVFLSYKYIGKLRNKS
ncbi:MAG: hypothetical protein QG654_10 [Patescibacteria group bacterium]|nr:hypothetical protein [Patescibacteria group bacterium]